jgi:hypothetical protein
MPPVGEWDTFPFEGEIRVRLLEAPVAEEKPRHGAGGIDCRRCATPDDEYLWTDEHWRLWPFPKPTGLPVIVILEPRAHCDLPELPPERATELGPLILPPMPEDVWRENLAVVARELAAGGGTAPV